MSVIKEISVIIPARNEERAIAATLSAILESAACFLKIELKSLHLAATSIEVWVVDNQSSDSTREVVQSFIERHGVGYVHCERLRAPCARNCGAGLAKGKTLVFVDADTCIPREGISRVSEHSVLSGYEAGIFALKGDPETLSAQCWWGFWNMVRLLPMARAKALPAFMFCTRSVFEEFGPFDESVQIGEEWPILAGLYRKRRHRLVYDLKTRARTSNRRMACQRFGYSRTLLKYIWAILHVSGRNKYPDTIRG